MTESQERSMHLKDEKREGMEMNTAEDTGEKTTNQNINGRLSIGTTAK